MHITLNGEKKEVPDAITVTGLLEFLQIQRQRVAVELNQEIVKRDRYETTVIRDGDSLEVVSFMAGGTCGVKHEGSTYAEDGIRITGSRTFVDSVLSRLKDLLAFECDETRLQVVYDRSVDRESGKALKSWNCYVQVHGRGGAPDKKKTAKKKQAKA